MFRILALSDKPSHYLEQRLAQAGLDAPAFDAICNCGDLDRAYMERVTFNASGEVYYVNGNHDPAPPRRTSFYDADSEQLQAMLAPGVGENLHGKVALCGGYYLCGFNGARSDQERPYHISEKTMRAVTRRVERRLRWLRWWDRLRGRAFRPLIVLSHAPPRGVQDGGGLHEGFTCFVHFMQKTNPLLWLHGHVHLQAFNQIEKTRDGETLVVNVFEFKVITIDGQKIDVNYRL